MAATRTHGLYFRPTKHELRLMGFGDASFEADTSQTGVVLQLGGMVVGWRNTNQAHVARPTAEAEAVALATASLLLESVEALLAGMF